MAGKAQMVEVRSEARSASVGWSSGNDRSAIANPVIHLTAFPARRLRCGCCDNYPSHECLPGRCNSCGVQYIWSDAQEGNESKGLLFNDMHSKTKVLPPEKKAKSVSDLSIWSYDGSSTNQAEGNDSDLLIKPVRTFPDPIRGGDHLLAVCELLNPDGSVHKDNSRRPLENMIDQKIKSEEPWFGLEQEYTMLNSNGWPYMWPTAGYPEPQGNNYCAVGNNSVYGRKLADAHMKACIDAGITIAGKTMPFILTFSLHLSYPNISPASLQASTLK